jgi:hypothetical protein
MYLLDTTEHNAVQLYWDGFEWFFRTSQPGAPFPHMKKEETHLFRVRGRESDDDDGIWVFPLRRTFGGWF